MQDGTATALNPSMLVTAVKQRLRHQGVESSELVQQPGYIQRVGTNERACEDLPFEEDTNSERVGEEGRLFGRKSFAGIQARE